MNKEELKKEAEEYLENNYCKNVCTRAENKHCKSGLQVRCCSFNEKKKFILSFAEPREKRIEELERKLEQTEKGLTDYQFNYPKIKDLEKENALLKGRNKGFEQQIMGLLIKYEEVYKRFPDLKSAMDKAQTLLKENAELKIKNKNADSLKNKLEEDNYNLTCNLNATLDRLNEATELLKATLLMAQVEGLKVRYETVDDIEQFLKDCDIDNAIQQANKGLDFDKIADEMEQDLKDSEVEK